MPVSSLSPRPPLRSTVFLERMAHLGPKVAPPIRQKIPKEGPSFRGGRFFGGPGADPFSGAPPKNLRIPRTRSKFTEKSSRKKHTFVKILEREAHFL